MRLLLLALGLVAGGAFAFLAWGQGMRGPWLQAWLVAVLFWLGPALGGMLWLLARHLGTPGGGPEAPLRALAASLPVPLLAFVPVGVGLAAVLPWAAPGADTGGLAAGQGPWMSAPGVLIRTGVIFILWLVLALAAVRGRLGAGLAGAGLAAALVGLMLFLVDWPLGLTPGWSAQVFPFALGLGLVLAAPAMLALVGGAAAGRTARWLCAGALFVLYLLFLQHLVIWTTNLPEQVTWYLARRGGPWQDLATAGFALLGTAGAAGLVWPRLLAGGAVRVLAAAILAGDVLVIVWMLLPSFAPARAETYWMTGLALAGLGGLWGLVYGFLSAFFARRGQPARAEVSV